MFATAHNGTKPKRRPSNSTAFLQAKQLQQIAMDDCLNPETKPVVRAALMRAWCDLEERKRVLRMKPLPKSVDVSQAKEQRRQARLARRPPDPNFLEVEKGISSSETPPGTPAAEGGQSSAPYL